MKEKLTREVIGALAKCSGAEYSKCENCPATKICDSTDETVCKWLATALLEEMDKPKDDVWMFAPDGTTTAEVFYGNGQLVSAAPDHTYTRELPKTRALQIAEEIEEALRLADRYKPEVKTIESVLKKYAAELKGKE